MNESKGRRAFESLPAAVQANLKSFRESLVTAIGTRLGAIVIHGSAVRGDFRDGASDIDVIVVLEDTSLDTLEAISNPLAVGRNAWRIEAMLLKPSEIADAADAFPVFYGEIKDCHAILGERDPFESLEIPPENVRLRIEQELREAKIRLRRAVTDSFGMPKVIAGALERKLRQVRGPLRALLALKGRNCGDGLEEVLSACATEYRLELSALYNVTRSPEAAHAAFRQLMDAAIADVDGLDG